MSSEMNEYASYQPNQLVATEIGSFITGMGFLYSGYIVDPTVDDLRVECKLDIELNSDDVDVTMTDNVIYCFIDSRSISTIIKPDQEIYKYANYPDILRFNKFIPVNQKAWKDDHNLYLLKINLNSGIISRYDVRTGRFARQTVNWKSSTPTEVVELLLTKEYLDEYFRYELNCLGSYVSFVSEADMADKSSTESVTE